MTSRAYETLTHIREIHRRTDPAKFRINGWYFPKTGCGCLVGRGLQESQWLRDWLGMELYAHPDYETLLPRFMGEGPTAFEWARMAEEIGITTLEAHELFNPVNYVRLSGPAAYREAMAKLDRAIEKYAPKMPTAQEVLSIGGISLDGIFGEPVVLEVGHEALYGVRRR